MQFKIEDLANLFEGEVLHALDDGSISIKIDGKNHNLRLLKSATNEFEFILDNTFHHVRILQSTSAEAKMMVDGHPLSVKKHSKLTEVLEKAAALAGTAGGDKTLASQIPGRVVSIATKVGSEVKKGDVILVLESMKMQVAVKAHKDGVIKDLRIKQGATVARNDVLAIID